MQNHIFSTRFTACAAFITLLFLAQPAFANTVSVMWDPNVETSVAGYYVHVGTQPGTYTQKVDVGTVTSWTFSNAVAGQQYCFSVSAYKAGPLEGPRSNEVCGFSNAPPALVNPGSQTSTVGEPLTLQLAGSDPMGEPVSYSATGLPPGLTLMASTGFVAGTPTTTGTYSVTARVSDGVLTASQSFTWTIVVPDSTPPTITITGPTSAATFATSAMTLTLSGAASDAVGVTQVTWVNSRGGSGAATGTSTWTVSGIALQAGTNVLTVTARDAAGNAANAALTVTVNAPPTLSAISNQSTVVGLATTLQLVGSDANGDPLTYTASGLPAGLSIAASTGLISGAPTTVGTYNVTASVSDGASSASSLFTWNVTTASQGPLSVSLSANRTAPQPVGSVTTFTAKASGGEGAYQYKWWVYDGYYWQVVQQWTTSATFAWQPTTANANYRVGVWIRNASTTTDTLGASTEYPFAITNAASAPLSVSLSANRTAPQPVGSLTTFTATASGGEGAYQYKWWVYDGGYWRVIQNWTTSATYAWQPTTANASYRVGVWIRNASTTTDTLGASTEHPFAITNAASAPLAVSLSANRTAPQPVGSVTTFTATATGGEGAYQYKWWVYDGGYWRVIQNWTTSATYAWQPTTANASYRVGVWIRNASTTTDTLGASTEHPFAITHSASAPLAVSLSANRTAPQSVGSVTTFTATATGGEGAYQYKWWVYDGYYWQVVQQWTTSATYAWQPTTANANYRVGVWVRNASTTTDTLGASMEFPFAITNAAAPLSVSLSANRFAPQPVGTVTTFTASAAGGEGAYQYKWWVYDGYIWRPVTGWSTSRTYAWQPLTPNASYRVGVWVRNASTTTDTMGASAEFMFPIK